MKNCQPAHEYERRIVSITMSAERIQKVVFVRHGVAKHNLPDPSTGKLHNLRDPALTDPSLVYQGKQQALHAGLRLKEWWHASQRWNAAQERNDVELVVTSVSKHLHASFVDRSYSTKKFIKKTTTHPRKQRISL